jgi:hypothetical protein
MYIQSPAEYQQALEILEKLQNSGTNKLSTEEKLKWNEIVRAIESYQYRNDPVSLLARIG